MGSSSEPTEVKRAAETPQCNLGKESTSERSKNNLLLKHKRHCSCLFVYLNGVSNNLSVSFINIFTCELKFKFLNINTSSTFLGLLRDD